MYAGNGYNAYSGTAAGAHGLSVWMKVCCINNTGRPHTLYVHVYTCTEESTVHGWVDMPHVHGVFMPSSRSVSVWYSQMKRWLSVVAVSPVYTPTCTCIQYGYTNTVHVHAHVEQLTRASHEWLCNRLLIRHIARGRGRASHFSLNGVTHPVQECAVVYRASTRRGQELPHTVQTTSQCLLLAFCLAFCLKTMADTTWTRTLRLRRHFSY